MNQGKILLPGDHALPDDLEPLRFLKKLERVSSFRQLQAHSAMSEQITKRRLTDYESSHHGLHLSPVSAGQFRHVFDLGATQRACIVNAADGRILHDVLPENLPEKFPQMTLGEDQCLCNSAGSYFADTLGTLHWTHYDIIHRKIRDANLTFKHCMNGRVLRARHCTPHLEFIMTPSLSPIMGESEARPSALRFLEPAER